MASAMAPERSTSADVRTSLKDCDCDGNQLDALGVCGGDCAEDADADGICDDVDPCVGESTRVACATARKVTVDLRTSLKETATAAGTTRRTR